MIYLPMKIDSPPHGCHVFQQTEHIFKHIYDIIRNQILDNKCDLRVLTRKCPAPGSHVFQSTTIILEFVQDIIGKNLLTKFHEDLKKKCPTSLLTCFSNIIDQFDDNQKINDFNDDWMINVASRVLTRKTDLPSGGHVFQEILTKFHED
ncbi:hypothetical protein DPMN_009786 [Dreissena polymorpha]|uniref:Uncharacterized protein n=1 Tax=Dreissena polymorpha TaxID=45954 RepID=A0A9D4N0T8_DREPO|nr:hypothetical protein DPMN_009786 [Dreissena polymorpha]